MPAQLLRLMQSYEFLKTARLKCAGQWPPRDIGALDERIDQLFLDIVRYQCDEPRVTATQLRFLLTCLEKIVGGDQRAEALRSACEFHLDRLTGQAVQARLASSAPPPERHYLDSLSDRIGIIDTEYRYIFTNKANATFHKARPQDFVGRSNVALVGARYFERVNKARLDACLAGQSFSFISPHPCGRPDQLFFAKMEPVRDDTGSIIAAMVVSREVTDLPIPPDRIETLP